MLCTCLPAGPSATQIRRAIPGPEDERAQNAPSGSGAVRPNSISPSSLTDIARRYHPVRHKRDRDGRHQAVRDAAAAQVAVTAGQCTAPRTRSGRRKQRQCSSNAAEPCPRSAAGTSPNNAIAILLGCIPGHTGRLPGFTRSAIDQHWVVTPQVLHQAPRPETTSVRPAATTSTTPPERCCKSSPRSFRCHVVRQAGDPRRIANKELPAGSDVSALLSLPAMFDSSEPARQGTASRADPR